MNSESSNNQHTERERSETEHPPVLSTLNSSSKNAMHHRVFGDSCHEHQEISNHEDFFIKEFLMDVDSVSRPARPPSADGS